MGSGCKLFEFLMTFDPKLLPNSQFTLKRMPSRSRSRKKGGKRRSLGSDLVPMGPPNQLQILVLVTACHGFGDLVFAYKVTRYLQDWYKEANVKLASTLPKQLESLGVPLSIQYQLWAGKKPQCRRLSHLSFMDPVSGDHIPTPIADLIFIAPLPADQSPNLVDVRGLLSYASELNTYTFSEYNHPESKTVDFPMGVGPGLYGLTLTSPSVGGRLGSVPRPYALAYIADIDQTKMCINAFIEMVTSKYHKTHRELDIVVPGWLAQHFLERAPRVRKYTTVQLIWKDESKALKTETLSEAKNGDDKSIVRIRADVLPLPNPDMLRLIKYSVQDILVTGDQSVTDVLSCCPEKNIFYQIASWKLSFGHNLAKYLPNKYLSSVKTSCGTMKALSYASKYDKFIQQWDFRQLGRAKMDAIVAAAYSLKLNPGLVEFIQSAWTRRTKRIRRSRR